MQAIGERSLTGALETAVSCDGQNVRRASVNEKPNLRHFKTLFSCHALKLNGDQISKAGLSLATQLGCRLAPDSDGKSDSLQEDRHRRQVPAVPDGDESVRASCV